MLAYANPPDRKNEKQRGDGFGVVRFNKGNRQVTFECWPRFADVQDGDAAQYTGWPITIDYRDNDGRKPVGWLPELVFPMNMKPVVQVVEEDTGEILYTVRSPTNRFRAPTYALGPHSVKVGREKPIEKTITGLTPGSANSTPQLVVEFDDPSR